MLYDALMRLDELLAYADQQKNIQFRVSCGFFLWITLSFWEMLVLDANYSLVMDASEFTQKYLLTR